jgi:hypothetical protein
MDTSGRRYRAGESIEDFCRACKTDRMHTVVAADAEGRPIRVDCGFCHSEHNYRGGPRVGATPGSPAPAPRGDDGGPAGKRARGDAAAFAPSALRRASPELEDASAERRRERVAPHGDQRRTGAADPRSRSGGEPFPIVSERERTGPTMTPDREVDLELLLRRVIREEAGITPVAPADRWRGGTLVLRPGTPGLQEKTWPIETFFHKVVMLRNRLRTLEQQINSAELPDDVKVRLQGYISGCYGTLTSFNVLFAEEEDQFKGAGGD